MEIRDFLETKFAGCDGVQERRDLFNNLRYISNSYHGGEWVFGKERVYDKVDPNIEKGRQEVYLTQGGRGMLVERKKGLPGQPMNTFSSVH